MNSLNTMTLISIVVVLAIIGGLIAALAANNGQQQLLSITTFAECAAAGYPVMETYPEQCATPDGRTFVNESQSIGPVATSTAAGKNGCAVAGCSGQLCVSADEANDIVTTCEYRAEYACYKTATCESQASGKCGWSETPELTRCLANPPTPDTTPEPVF